MEFFADVVERHAIAGGQRQALDWLIIGFAGEFEGLVVHGENEVGSGVVGHLECLLGIAVRVNPRVVSADRHDGKIYRH